MNLLSIKSLFQKHDKKLPDIEEAQLILYDAESNRSLKFLDVEQYTRELQEAMMIGAPESVQTKANEKLRQAKEKLSLAEQRIVPATEILEAATTAHNAAIRQSKIETVRAHSQARNAAAKRLSAALEAAGADFRILIDESGEAANAYSSPLPRGGSYGAGELNQLLQHELYRNRLGGTAPNFLTVENRPAIPPLSAKITDGSAHVMGILDKGTGANGSDKQLGSGIEISSSSIA